MARAYSSIHACLKMQGGDHNPARKEKLTVQLPRPPPCMLWFTSNSSLLYSSYGMTRVTEDSDDCFLQLGEAKTEIRFEKQSNQKRKRSNKFLTDLALPSHAMATSWMVQPWTILCRDRQSVKCAITLNKLKVSIHQTKAHYCTV